MINITKIYLVTNIDNNPNKVYIGKTKTRWGRESKHKLKYGSQITYTYIDEVSSLNREDWKILETKWIQYYINLGYDVINKRKIGGSGPEYWTEEQKEKHKDEIYGYANDLSEITKIIYKYADEYICEYKNKIFREMEENDEISQNTFYKMFDSLPSVKYFDISPKIWHEYEIDEVELHEYFLSHFKSSRV